jgi:hypothetical protein
MKKNGMRPVPPGEILAEEFLKPLGLGSLGGVGPRQVIGTQVIVFHGSAFLSLRASFSMAKWLP